MYNYQIVAIFIFLSFYMYEILVHSFCRKHSDINSISSASKLIFPTAATCFFSNMGLCLPFFVREFWRFLITYHGESLELCSEYWPTSATVATKFQAVIPCNSCASDTFSSHPWRNKGTCHSSPFGHWSSSCSKGSRMNYNTWLVFVVWPERCLLRFVKLGEKIVSDLVPWHIAFDYLAIYNLVVNIVTIPFASPCIWVNTV